jgi:Ohr subfamily peroxiredoxin
MTVLYTAEATATGAGRDGRTRSSDGVLDLDLAVPKELGGAGGAATNPEQLFAAGYAACFHSALQLVARRAKVSIADSSVTAQVGIGRNGDGGFGLDVGLVVDLPGVPREQAQDLVTAADEVCPYSNAIRGNVEIELRLA